MKPDTTVSIVVPSLDQARFLGETLQSLVDQEYPRLQVVIQDGCSSDGSAAIAREYVQRFPGMFQLFVEKDSGHADALNRGFARATGEILGFLNSDDTLFPRILHRVVAEIDPARGRHIVMGRCVFTGEGSRYVGLEHPAEYHGHFDHLAIWTRGFNTIPQPSVFWHRAVWERCGGIDPTESFGLDYDLFCRFSARYRFHRVDELWSTYRMHPASQSSQRTEEEVLAVTIRLSRKHWGSWFSPLRWRCELSLRLHGLRLHERACHHARRAEDAFRSRAYLRAAVEFVKTSLCSPAMARDRLFLAWLARKRLRIMQMLISSPPDESDGPGPGHKG